MRADKSFYEIVARFGTIEEARVLPLIVREQLLERSGKQRCS